MQIEKFYDINELGQSGTTLAQALEAIQKAIAVAGENAVLHPTATGYFVPYFVEEVE